MMAKALKLILWIVLVDSKSAIADDVSNEQDSPIPERYLRYAGLSAPKEKVTPFTGGYQYYDGVGYYKLYTLPSSWGYAWKQCKEDGGHLVVIDSDEENKIVRNMMKESKVNVYVGAHDIFIEGWYFTVTGNRLISSSYNRWRDDEPNDDSRDCVIMNKNGELENKDCDNKFYFLCEVEIK